MGGSIAGLVAARVLSRHFAKVTIFERDPTGTCTPRPGAPQGRHLHILLPSGVTALASLFPGRIDELVRGGAKRFDYGRSHLYVYGTWLPRVDTQLAALAQTRPFLEQYLRQWVGEIPNVQGIHQANVVGPILDRSGSRVVGVEFSERERGETRRLSADLVVDATGRNTRLPRWLNDNGFGNVPESKIGIQLGYATGLFHLPEKLRPDSPLLYIVGPPPHQTKVGVLFQAENGIVFGGMGGYHGDYPPSDLDGFLQFARNLSQPDIFDVLSRSELCSRIQLFRIPCSLRRHYDRVREFPDGVLPIGDSICSLDPAFGQGMSIAAIEAQVLSRCLENCRDINGEFRRNYLRHVNAVLDAAWILSSRENLRYPQTTGPRPWRHAFATRYMNFLVSSGDPIVAAEVYKVISLSAEPTVALHPKVAVRALSGAIRSRRSKLTQTTADRSDGASS
jgi:2-polyprenyl-6-methoxyphenol hydroxylase-like FAD-dependent oxidoreductase